MLCRERDGLRAGEVGAFALEKVCDFATELLCEFRFGFDAYIIKVGDWVAHFNAIIVCKDMAAACMKCDLAELKVKFDLGQLREYFGMRGNVTIEMDSRRK